MARDLAINPVSGKGIELHGVVRHGVAFADNGKSQPSILWLDIVISKSDEFSLGLYPPRGSGSSQGRRPLGSKNFDPIPGLAKKFHLTLKVTDSR